MKFEIGKAIKKVKRKDVYKLNIQFMFGDADGYEDVVIYFKKDAEGLDRLFAFLKTCKEMFPHGRGGGEKYSYSRHIPIEFNFFCGDGDGGKNELFFDWPHEPHYYSEATLDSYKVTYFDENEVEFEVLFDFEP